MQVKKEIYFLSGVGGNLGSYLAKYYLQKGKIIIGLTSKSKKSFSFLKIKKREFENFHVFQCNLLNYEETDKILKNIIRTYPNIKVIINCHGSAMGLEKTLKAYKKTEELFRLNCSSIIQIIETLLKNKNKMPKIICNISSISGVENHGHPVYCASKAALIAYTRSIGRYLSSKGTSVFSVSPGAFEDEQGYWKDLRLDKPKKLNDFLKHRMAIGRLAKTEEVAKFITGLINNANPLFAGNNYVFDGGQGRSW